MATDSVQRLVTLLQLPESREGHQITGDEAKEIWNEVVRSESTDPSDKPVEIGEKKILTDLLESGSLTSEAKDFLGKMLAEKVPNLLAEAPSPVTPTAPTSENHILIEGKPLAITAEGLPLLNPEGTPTANDKEEGFYQLALLLSREQQGELNLDSLKSLPLETKAKLVDNAIALAQGETSDLSADEANQLRSSAFTVLFGLARTLPQGTMTSSLSDKVHTALVDIAKNESHARLANHMTRLLNRDDYTTNLNRSQKTECTELFEARFPQKFDVKNILDEDGYISWEHAAGQGENMYRSFCANLLKKEIGGAKFVEVESGPGHRNFELQFDPPRDDVKGVRVQVREFRNDMFNSLGQKKGFSYGGHSNIGLNQEKSVANALARGLKANSPQLAVLDLCAGLDGLDDALENLGDVEVLSTFSSSFYWKGNMTDERGEFEGIHKSEGLESLIPIWDGLSRSHDYETMRKNVGDAIWNWSHPRNPNVVFPTFKDYREVRWMHLDGDDDGRMDANDILYQFGLSQATRAADSEFELRDSGAYDTLNGDTVRDAALDLNVSSHYNSVTHGNSNVEHVFMGNGYFDGTDSDELVRFTEATNMDGKEVIEITVNSKLAHTSREALSALVQYEMMMQLSESGELRISDDEVDRKLMSLTFAAFRLNYDNKGRFNDQRIWKQLLKTMRLPSDIPYGPIARLLSDEHHDYAGSLKMAREYKKLLREDVVKTLESPEVGRPGFGPPNS